MISRISAALLALSLSACAIQPVHPPVAGAPVEVQILAINDFHGNIETPPDPPSITQADASPDRMEWALNYQEKYASFCR